LSLRLKNIKAFLKKENLTMKQPTVFEIINLTPKNNCEKCGYKTCMAFAVALLTGKIKAEKCPYIKLEGLKNLGLNSATKQKLSIDPDTALLKELKSKISNVNLEKIAKDLGANIIKTKEGVNLKLLYLGENIIISHNSITREDLKELDPRDQILLYNYVYFGGKGELSGQWVGLESFPNSISKVNTLKKYTEDKLAQYFGDNIDELYKKAKKLMAQKLRVCHADICLEIPALPKVPLQIHFWGKDIEEGFDAQVKILFDSRAIKFLDIESLVFTAERMAEKLMG